MDAQQFLAEFGRIANAPGGIGKLRELILQLAIQGRLIAVTTVDTSSRTLLADVRAIKSDLVAKKKLPREKPFPAILKGDITVDTPPHWEWVRFGEVWHLLSGRDLEPSQYNDSKNGAPYITGASNLENGTININRWTPEPVVISANGDLLITCKGTIGKTAFNTLGEIHIARQIMAVRNFSEQLNTGFLKIWLDGFVSQLVKKSKSMIPGFSRDDLVLAVYPVPPIEEQSRIVAKADELMALCDTLETQQQARRKLQNNLRQSTLQAVASATSPHELQTTWTRLAENFGRLFHVPEDVEGLRRLVLSLALSGVLTDQDEADSADSQLKTALDILEERANRKEFHHPSLPMPIKQEEISIPLNWVPKRLCEFAVVRGGKRVKKGYQLLVVPTPHVYIRVTDMKNGTVNMSGLRFIDDTMHQEIKRYIITDEDIYITIAGTIGAVGKVPKELSGAHLTENAARITAFGIEQDYLIIALGSQFVQNQFQDAINQMAQPKLALSRIEQTIVPIPPIAEQKKIVKRVSELMQICDLLESQLCNSSELSGRLASAVVSSITGIAIEQEEEPMKAPQTELIAPLRLGAAPDIKTQAPLATILARHNGEMAAKDLWQRFGGEIDAFYAQLKTEVAHGWILEPEAAEMREILTDTASA